jgi:predicted permease
MWSTLLYDLRYGLRQLLARPAFTMASMLSLAVGIGANVALFSAVHALLLSPVTGIGAPDRVIELGRTRNGQGFDNLSYPDMVDFASGAKTVRGIFGYSLEPLNVNTARDPQRALGMLVSDNYFETLQTRPYRGRLLRAGDDANPESAPVAVASFTAWKKYFAGEEDIIGKTVSIDGRSFTLIGVAAPEFHGHIAVMSPDFYLPLHLRTVLHADGSKLFSERRDTWVLGGARLESGATLDQAQAEFSAIALHLEEAYPDSNKKIGVALAPLRGVPAIVRGPLGAFSGLLFGLIGLILMVACVNVAGMLIAKGESRRHEIAMRFVLGASRLRVIVQLLIESLLLALGAGALGVVFAYWGLSLVRLLDPPTPYPLALNFPIDISVIGFALAFTMATALVFGLLPALRVSSRAPSQTQAIGSRQIAGGRSRLREALVVVQIASTLILLVTCGLFIRALERAAAINVGFDAKQVLSAEFDLLPSGYTDERKAKLQQDLLQNLRTMPGVESAAIAETIPLNFTRMSFGCVNGDDSGKDSLCPDVNIVSDGFLQTLGMRIRGRGIQDSDTAAAADICVVNETMARRMRPDGDVLGHSFQYGESTSKMRTLTIVGVVADGRYASLEETTQPFMFMPLAQWPRPSTNLLVKTPLSANEFAQQLHEAVRRLDANLPATPVHPLIDVLNLSLLPQRIAGIVAGVLGGVGLLLVIMGLYGLIAYQVAIQTREFGIKLALGATSSRILREVLRRGAILCGIGLALGTAMALGIAQLISSLLFGSDGADAVTFVAAALVLGIIALGACYLPARRASRIAPMDALRAE